MSNFEDFMIEETVKKNEELSTLREHRALLRVALERLIDPTPCNSDHHGFCQAHAHLADGPCPQFLAKQALSKVRP